MKFLRGCIFAFLTVMILAGGYFLSAAPRSTNSLRTHKNNLDLLSDKGNNLHQLIEELQGFTSVVATAPQTNASGRIKLPGISTSVSTPLIIRFTFMVFLPLIVPNRKAFR